MNVIKNKDLQKLNTFGVSAKARYFVTPASENDLKKLIETDEYQSNQKLVLGGGSNMLFADDFDGIVINIGIKGMFMKEITDKYVVMEVGAGEVWDEFVNICVKNRYYGFENLAKIPGKVGAAAVQNIGAYGVEQAEYFHSLTAFDTKSGRLVELTGEDCRFAYRDSIFKHMDGHDLVITKIRYKLNKQFNPITKYAEVARELDKFSFVKPDGQYVYDMISRLRAQKLPDPEKLGNAGSFFKNPVVDVETYQKLSEKYDKIPAFEVGEMYKLSAGWLIEKCGWKGFRDGDAGVSDNHALILVNYGNATGRQIFDLSERIINDIHDKTGVQLQREVVVVGQP